MIRDLSQNEVIEFFLDLVIEIESGVHFKKENVQHTQWLKRQISRRFGSGAQFFGYFDEQNIAIGLGAIVISDHPFFPQYKELGGYSELVNLGVFSQYRGQGVGSKLIEHAEQLSKEAGVFCMYIATYAGSTENIAYYGKRDFTPVATLPDVNGPYDQGRLYMRKRL